MAYYLNKKGYKAIDDFLLEHAQQPIFDERHYFRVERAYMQGVHNSRDSYLRLKTPSIKTGLPVKMKLEHDYFNLLVPYIPWIE